MSSDRRKTLRTAGLSLTLLAACGFAAAQAPAPNLKGSFAVSFRPATPSSVRPAGIASLSNGVIATAFECDVAASSGRPYRVCLLLTKNGKVLRKVETSMPTARPADFGLYDLPEDGLAVDARDRIVVGASAEYNGVDGPVLFRYLPNGGLDRSFGGRGFVHLPVPMQTRAVAVDPQDRILVAGEVYLNSNPGSQPPNWGVRIYRLRPDGSLDASFGAGGAATADISDLGFFLRGSARVPLHVDAGGRITVATLAYHDPTVPCGPMLFRLVVARVLADGRLDPAFGQAGRSLVEPQPFYFPKGLGVDAAGRVLVAGYALDGSVGVAGLAPDGSLDTGFGLAGVATFGGPMALGGMAVQPDGKILLSGSGNPDLGVARYGAALMAIRFLADGSRLDPAFGTDGVAGGLVVSARENVAGYDGDVWVNRDGGILVSGMVLPGDRVSPLCRLAANPARPERQFQPECAAVKAFDANGVPEPSVHDRIRGR